MWNEPPTTALARRSRKARSSRIRTPSSVAFFSLLPASSPATTKSVFFETLPETFPPRRSTSSLAWSRAQPDQAPGEDHRLPGERPPRAVLGRHGLYPGGEQRLDALTVPRLVEEGGDDPGHLRAHVLHPGERFLVGLVERTDVAEVVGQRPGGGIADVADAQGVEEAAQRRVLAALQRPEEVLRALLSHPLQRGQRLEVEGVEVGGALHPAGVDQLLGQLLPQPLDVHPPPAGEVPQVGLELRRAGDVGAAEDGPVLVHHRRRAADRAVLGEDVGDLGPGPLRVHHLHDLGDDVAGAANEDLVADPDVLPLELQRVVQRGPGDGDPAHLHRGEEGHRGERAGAADVDLDGLHPRPRLLGGELVGDGPAGALRDLPQPPTGVLAVDLHHHPVDVVGQGVAALQEVGVGGAQSAPARPRSGSRG